MLPFCRRIFQRLIPQAACALAAALHVPVAIDPIAVRAALGFGTPLAAGIPPALGQQGHRADAAPGAVPRAELADAVRVHPGRKHPGLHLVRTNGHHRAQHPQAGVSAAEHLAVWEQAELGRDGRRNGRLCGRVPVRNGESTPEPAEKDEEEIGLVGV